VKVTRNLCFVNKGTVKMTKSKRKKQKGTPVVKAENNIKGQTKAAK